MEPNIGFTAKAMRELCEHPDENPAERTELAAIGAWRSEGRDIFVYFDNDIGAAAPKDAARLIAMAGESEPAG
jgi:uncharacterized protein YecE (DUF72 family)